MRYGCYVCLFHINCLCVFQVEEEKSQLVLENETQRQQYERCLDDIANQVVQALLSQKVSSGTLCL